MIDTIDLGEGVATVLNFVKVLVYWGNLTQGMHLNTPGFLQLKSKLRPIFDQKSPVFRKIYNESN